MVVNNDRYKFDCIDRSEVSARLSGEVVSKLHDRFSFSTDLGDFRERLVHILSRFERRRSIAHQPLKKVRRKLFMNVEKATSQLLETPEDLSAYLLENLVYQMKYDALDDWLKSTSSIFDTDPPPSPTLDETERFLKLLHRASKQMLVDLDFKPESNPEEEVETNQAYSRAPLDDLITDVQGTLQHHNSGKNSATCYYNAIKGEYCGALYEFTKLLLDSYAPDSYFSNAALGKRITRVLKKDT
ncbi:hypothetical protein [Roseovarius pelagicus]|uniref:Uncharacterized protein n=1 Tax=Roseovarius pelagicus TaxID=2980108 RepID=A0ABY6DB07_9RHOB|nr:hypothetical protein [Roseovarius pelagicus]UXX82213.1 hypothetical protein N7U68_14010 [Roseovarius pelagicus]